MIITVSLAALITIGSFITKKNHVGPYSASFIFTWINYQQWSAMSDNTDLGCGPKPDRNHNITQIVVGFIFAFVVMIYTALAATVVDDKDKEKEN